MSDKRNIEIKTFGLGSVEAKIVRQELSKEFLLEREKELGYAA